MTINKTKPSDPTVNGDSLSFQNDIAAEFGPGSYSLGQYRRDDPRFTNKNVGALKNLPLDNGVPINGEIKFSDFYGKKLNVIVNYYNGNQETVKNQGRATLAASHRYVNERTGAPNKVVGGFAQVPDASVTNAASDYLLSSTQWRGGKKIIVHVNKTIGGKDSGPSDNAFRDSVSLRTGRWPSGTTLQVDVGASGKIYGAGGKGGHGGRGLAATAQNGYPGMSALGIEYAATINNSGIIRCGYAGGGGGSGAGNDPSDKTYVDYGRSGGGGGGGAGLPAGTGGAKGTGSFNPGSRSIWYTYDGRAGFDGNLSGGGAGGPAQAEGGATGGAGGQGGDFVDPAGNGVKGDRRDNRAYRNTPGEPGSAGVDGKAIYYRSTAIRNASTVTGNSVGGRNGGEAVSIDIR